MQRILLFFSFMSISAVAMASEGGFSWTHFLFHPLELPLAKVGIDPTPLFDMLVASFFLIGIAYIGGKPFRQQEMVVPTGKLSLSHLMEVVVGALDRFLSGIIHHGLGYRPFFPLLGTYALFIVTMNLMGLIPGFNPPTDQFNVTILFGLIIFVTTHVIGFRVSGFHYLKQFVGPMWAIAWLMIPIELISHMVRPLSLAIRLFGNMTGDHKVVMVFTSICAVLLPVPFMGLGVLVSILQAFVFVLLSAIYFESAMTEHH